MDCETWRTPERGSLSPWTAAASPSWRWSHVLSSGSSPGLLCCFLLPWGTRPVWRATALRDRVLLTGNSPEGLLGGLQLERRMSPERNPQVRGQRAGGQQPARQPGRSPALSGHLHVGVLCLLGPQKGLEQHRCLTLPWRCPLGFGASLHC